MDLIGVFRCACKGVTLLHTFRHNARKPPLSRGGFQCCSAGQLCEPAKIFFVCGPVFGVEERIVALMQMLNIIVVRPGNVRIGQCNGVEAEVGTLIRDAFDVRQRIQKAESAVDRAFAV